MLTFGPDSVRRVPGRRFLRIGKRRGLTPGGFERTRHAMSLGLSTEFRVGTKLRHRCRRYRVGPSLVRRDGNDQCRNARSFRRRLIMTFTIPTSRWLRRVQHRRRVVIGRLKLPKTVLQGVNWTRMERFRHRCMSMRGSVMLAQNTAVPAGSPGATTSRTANRPSVNAGAR
jgi:hypothetical protein